MLFLELYFNHKRVSLRNVREIHVPFSWKEVLRKKHMDTPPEGITPEDIRRMSEDALLDMDYFLNEDDLFADEAGVEGFYIF